MIFLNVMLYFFGFFFFSSRRRHTRSLCDWISDVCSSDLLSPDGLNVSDAIRQQAIQMVERTASRRFEDLIDEALLIGSPATIRERVARLQAAGVGELVRSEERRVGKECRSRWAAGRLT